jgi:radical SAM protein with 4Fe4S-binding SPASM domain
MSASSKPLLNLKNWIKNLPPVRDRRYRKYDNVVQPIIQNAIDDTLSQDPFPIFKFLEIETLNRCNGGCSFCPVNKRDDPRTYTRMKEELFESIVNELSQINYQGSFHLYSNNEPLLDKRIINFAKMAREAMPNAYIVLLSNGTLIDIEKYEALAPNLNRLLIDNYSDQHIKHSNVAEVEAHWEKNPPKHLDFRVQMRLETEVLTTRGGNAPNKRSFPELKSSCIVPFQQMVVRPTGEVSLCSNDALGEITLGDVSKNGLLGVWRGEPFKKIRQDLMKGRSHIPMCSGCDSFYGDVPYPEWRAN